MKSINEDHEDKQVYRTDEHARNKKQVLGNQRVRDPEEDCSISTGTPQLLVNGA